MGWGLEYYSIKLNSLNQTIVFLTYESQFKIPPCANSVYAVQCMR